MSKRTFTPLERYKLLIARRNWKVEQGIPLHLWTKYGHELKAPQERQNRVL
jgi:hypothetical protein